MSDAQVTAIDPPASAVAPPAAPGRARFSERATKIVLEVVLIGVGVFLGLAGEQWRASAERRAEARATLERFRGELQANRAALAASIDYHASTRTKIREYLRLPEAERQTSKVRLDGVQVVFFAHTAWDLALPKLERALMK